MKLSFFKKPLLKLTTFLLFAIMFAGCNEDTPESKTYNIQGTIQKGPFVKGSIVTISELDDDFSATGKTFSATITDNKGTFELANAELQNPVVAISADGFFFNEVNGQLSGSRIVLSAIVDLLKTSTINVNIITTIENERVKYLIEQGLNFDAAKAEARNNVLNIFGFTSTASNNPETYNITQTGNENSMLLAISAIMLGTHTEAELTELISGISTDLKTDGLLDDTTLQSELINEAKTIDCSTITTNLQTRYNELGEAITSNEFEKYIELFISKTAYSYTKNIEYPETTGSMVNILANKLIKLESSIQYSIAAKLPKGTSIRVEVVPSEGYSHTEAGLTLMENIGWTIVSPLSDHIILEAEGTGKVVSIPFMVGPPVSVDFLIFENGSTTPTRKIVLTNIEPITETNIKDTVTVNFQYGEDGPSSDYKNIYVIWMEAPNFLQNISICQKLIKGGLTGTALPYWKINKYPQASSAEVDAVTSATIQNKDFTISTAIKDTSVKEFTLYFETDRSFDPNDWFDNQPALLYAAKINLNNAINEYELQPVGWTPNEDTENEVENTPIGVLQPQMKYITNYKSGTLFGTTDPHGATKMVKKITVNIK